MLKYNCNGDVDRTKEKVDMTAKVLLLHLVT